MNVTFLTNIIAPYRRALFADLASTPGWNLSILTNAETEFDRDWRECSRGLPVRRIPSWSLRRTVRTTRPVPVTQTVELHIPYGLARALRQAAPDVVITHELGPRSALAALWCQRNGIPLVVWSYQSLASATKRGLVRRLVRNYILGRAGSVVGMGQQARQVLRLEGVAEHLIFDAPNAADAATMQQRLIGTQPPELRTTWLAATSRQRIAVVSGRLIPVKGIDTILAAWQRLSPSLRAQWGLVIVGDGPLAPMVRDAAGDGIHWHGSVPHNEIADVFAAADLQIFATAADVWGLVVNEAMHCGTPTLCSRHAGCVDDLVQHGRNGFVFDPLEATSFDRELSNALRSPSLAEMGRRAQHDVARFFTTGMAQGFRDAVALATRTQDTGREAHRAAEHSPALASRDSR